MASFERKVIRRRTVSIVGRRFRSGQGGRLLTRCFAVPLFICAVVVASPASQLPKADTLQTLQGKLALLPGKGPVLKTEHKDYPLTGKTSYLFHTLEDKRLLDRNVRLEGRITPDGTFEVERLFTRRGGKLYRVRYYCEVCNIEWLEPGDCVCCQRPTELQEIPVDETKLL